MHASRIVVTLVYLVLGLVALPAHAATVIVRLSNTVFTPNDLTINVGAGWPWLAVRSDL